MLLCLLPARHMNTKVGKKTEMDDGSFCAKVPKRAGCI